MISKGFKGIYKGKQVNYPKGSEVPADVVKELDLINKKLVTKPKKETKNVKD